MPLQGHQSSDEKAINGVPANSQIYLCHWLIIAEFLQSYKKLESVSAHGLTRPHLPPNASIYTAQGFLPSSPRTAHRYPAAAAAQVNICNRQVLFKQNLVYKIDYSS